MNVQYSTLKIIVVDYEIWLGQIFKSEARINCGIMAKIFDFSLNATISIIAHTQAFFLNVTQ